MDDKTKNFELPDAQGHFGPFGGKYVIETLMPALDSLEKLYQEVRKDPKVQSAPVHQEARNFLFYRPLFYLF
jgi:tryptophan synthase beta chain